jgi:SAM-dependent methyltransferase
MKATERFSDRVENYRKYRPHYPKEIIPFLKREIGLTSSSVIADIGSGTGISTEMFLKNGNVVYAVEPNTEMRLAAEEQLSSYPNFHSINATAEATTLFDRSIDIITSFQAFHWFDARKAKVEFKRIMKSGGWIVLIWNNRLLDASSFLIAFEKLLNVFGTDYPVMQDSDIYENIKILFEGKSYNLKEFPNSQSFDYEGLHGRLLSASYIPTAADTKYHPMLEELRRIFNEFQIEDRVEILYKTEVFYGRF